MPLHNSRRIDMACLAVFAGLLLCPLKVAAESADHADFTSYVLLDAGTNSATIDGSIDDLHRAQSLRAGQEELLYLRQGTAAYVIRDRAVLNRVRSIFKPQEVLGSQRVELASRRAALAQRRALLADERAALANQRASGSAARSDDLVHREEALARQEDALSRQEDVLAKEEDKLSRQEGRLAGIARQQVQSLFADALRLGLAQPLE